MKKKKVFFDLLITVFVLSTAFLLNLLLDALFETKTLIPMIFVLGIFIISLSTEGYFWGVTASVISVVLVNYAFTYPYYGIDLVSPECIVSALVMLIVAIMTCTLTNQIKKAEKIKAEIETESMRANLLRAISHDLRTPLTTVYGASSAIIENYDSLTKKDQVKLLLQIQDDSEWLIHMVENLLSVTRIDGQNVRIKKTPTVLEELVDAVLLQFKKRCPDTNINVIIPDDFVSIPMDAMLIQQVLINVLENAVHHAKGMTKLELSVKTENGKAYFSVSDDGCGIDESILPHIFTGYFDRKNAVSDSSRNNMGIGLSVCSAIIKAHGGAITAENLPSGGAVFKFDLETENDDEQ